MELLKDYDISNSLSLWQGLGSLTFLRTEERPLALEVHSLAKLLIKLDISPSHSVLAFVEARSTLMDQIHAHQFDDDKLCAIRDKV